ncbi:MAG: DUF438 domain-containing protein [Candidatus Saccharicenans sp.]|nr:DUF438 domain-containing protein [Candidatus Saccharicenans sp.]
MELNEKTSLYSLLREYPFLLDFLVSLAPTYKNLKNPLLRRTVARVATLKRVAEEGGLPVEELIEKIKKEIEARSGQAAHPAELAAAETGGDARRREKRERLKEIIRELHRGGEVDELKKRFAALVGEVGAEEIATLEQELIAEGLPEEEVKRLCDLHVKIFEESLEEQPAPSCPPGHPVHTMMAENRAAEKILAELRLLLERIPREPAEAEIESNLEELGGLLERLAEIEKHYLKKENQLFPLLEEHGITGPTRVMWAIHDDIRKELKEARQTAVRRPAGLRDALALASRVENLLRMIQDMIYKEEKILFPMSLDILKDSDWARVKRGEEEIGYAWVKPGTEWKPSAETAEAPAAGRSAGYGEVAEKKEEPQPEKAEADVSGKSVSGRQVGLQLDLRTGRLTPEQIDLMLTHLPVDISFVDETDTVIYYSDTPDRIFPRSPGVIGRKVQNCHPPKSIHMVNRILEAFKKGERDVAEFWIETGGRFVHIRYFAVRDGDGHYRGCLEVSQDVTSIRKLQGEKRLLDWD